VRREILRHREENLLLWEKHSSPSKMLILGTHVVAVRLATSDIQTPEHKTFALVTCPTCYQRYDLRHNILYDPLVNQAAAVTKVEEILLGNHRAEREHPEYIDVSALVFDEESKKAS
jgi:hypothetical protein